MVNLSNDSKETVAFTESLCNTVGITISVPTSTPTLAPTGTPLPLSTSGVGAHSQNYTDPAGSLNISTSTKPTAPTATSVDPSSGSSALTGNAARHYAQYVWAGTLLGTAFILLL